MLIVSALLGTCLVAGSCRSSAGLDDDASPDDDAADDDNDASPDDDVSPDDDDDDDSIAGCDLTFSLAGTDTICSANLQLPYPSSLVKYGSINNGTIDSGFTIIANDHGTSVEFTTQGYPGGAGPGSFAVLHFTALTGAKPEKASFTPTSATFADCNIPPSTISPAYSFDLSCQ